jgi:hypothetical protein
MQSVKDLLSSDALKTIYYSIFHCHLVFAIKLWSCTSSSFLTEMALKAKQEIIIICKAKFNSHTEPLLIKIGILPFGQLADCFKLQFMQLCNQNFLPPKNKVNWIKHSDRRQEEKD